MVMLRVLFSGGAQTFEFDELIERRTRNRVVPHTLLAERARNGDSWEIDFSKATKSELLEWGKGDFVGRILSALLKNRPVHFNGDVYTRLDQGGELDDAIANSGHMVMIARDDEEGLWIGTRGRE